MFDELMQRIGASTLGEAISQAGSDKLTLVRAQQDEGKVLVLEGNGVSQKVNFPAPKCG